MKKITIILAIFYLDIAFTISHAMLIPNTSSPIKMVSDSTMDIIDPPDVAAIHFIEKALSSLKELKKQNQASVENIATLMKVKILPNVALDVATELALKKHWIKLNNQQKLIFQKYIQQSLIKDYAGILNTYDRPGDINIKADPQIKRKDNKAIVKLLINLHDNSSPIMVSLKMIWSYQWRIYDVVFSGVSLMKNYQAQFDSHIKRKGIESLITKIVKKTK